MDLNSIPESPEDSLKLFEQIESGGDVAAPVTSNNGEDPAAKEAVDQAKAAADAKAAKAADAEAAAKAAEAAKAEDAGGKTEGGASEEDAAGVATKDGKHVIPYSVLKTEREGRQRAETLLQEVQGRVQFLEAALSGKANQGANNGEGARTDATQDLVSEEELATLKEDFPTVHKALTATMARAAQLEAKFKPVEETVRTAQADEARTAQQTVQDAIDSEPRLAHLQASDADGFKLAQQFDAILRGDPKWAGKPLSERFAKAADMVEAARGPIELPKTNAQEPTAAKPKDPKAVAAAKLAEAAKAGTRSAPTSLSEFPAGQHAAQDELEAIDQLSHAQLAEKFGRMTPDQIDAYFNSL